MDQINRIAVVDDESESLMAMSRALKKVGYEVFSYEDGEVALRSLETLKDVDLVVTDLKMPRVDGLDLLKAVREVNQEAGFLIVTAHGTVEAAVDAMKLGADDFILKPLDLHELRELAHHILETRRAQNELRQVRRQLGKQYGIDNLVAKSRSMQELLERAMVVAPTRSTVLLLGESGTGKDLLAQTLHQLSPRKEQRFLPLNCAALSPTLLESELFGYEKGAFTGAQERRAGKLEMADQGTLFLDEIGEMPLEMQVKLLRFLENREFMRVGGTQTLKLDVRLIAATNRSLEQAVAEGQFRQDLYYRLKVVTLNVPPLRERQEDIALLAWNFILAFAVEHQKPARQISPEAMGVLTRYRWPGNVRQLRNAMETVAVFSRNSVIDVEDLPAEIIAGAKVAEPARQAGVEPASSNAPIQMEGMAMSEIEKQAILLALEKTGGNRQKAAQMLGIGLRTLQSKLKEYGMTSR